jgi:hypothetical protein
MTDPSPSPDTDVGPSRGTGTTRLSRWQKLVGASGLAVVVWIGFDSPLINAWFSDGTGGMPDGMDHGPGGGPPEEADHTPGNDAPEGNEEQPSEPDEGEHAPPPGGWDH